MKSLKYTTIVLLAFLVFSCTNPPDYPDIPHIEYIGASKNVLRRGAFNEDTTFVTFSFTDGNGDIGRSDASGELDLFLEDKRTGVSVDNFRIPLIPKLGAKNGIRGEITFQLFTTCCNFPEDLGLDPCFDSTPEFPQDTVIYKIFIVDRAGNKSNVIETDPFFILCQ